MKDQIDEPRGIKTYTFDNKYPFIHLELVK